MTDVQSKSPRRLAIVDDDREFRLIIRRVAEPFGWRVSEFQDGHEFLAAIGGSLRPDLVILDMIMPALDGIETIGGLGGTSVRCSVVLVTGNLPLYTSAARELGLANGIEIIEAFQKPISLDQFESILNPDYPRNAAPGSPPKEP